MKKSPTTKNLLKFYKSRKYTSLRNMNKYNKIDDLKEFYHNLNLDYDILSEIPDKYLISVIQDYVLIRNMDTKLGDTHIIDQFDDVFKACYLLDDFFFTMRIGGFKTYYATIFSYYDKDTERLLEAIKEKQILELYRTVNHITGFNKLSKKEVLDRLINRDRIIDIEKLTIDKQDIIYDITIEIRKLSEKARKSLLLYVKEEIQKGKS
ncbi:hypothetical protein ACAG96_07890 [Candidatus Izemoplasma sp. B36]|uniref:hypothetical protein n=1 Tax=Candidatus Izemoplasma sp. B36 TaxID=3242468 RepID=UPI003558F652